MGAEKKVYKPRQPQKQWFTGFFSVFTMILNKITETTRRNTIFFGKLLSAL